MKRSIFLGGLLLATAGWSQGNFFNRGTITIASGSEVEVKGKVVLDNPVTGGGYFTLTGASVQEMSGEELEVDNFRMNGTGQGELYQHFLVHQSADFQSGKLISGRYHTRFDAGVTLSGGNTNSYIETSDTGKIIIPVTAAFLNIPTGSLNDYHPLGIQENGTADTFYIRAFGYLPTNGQYQGTPLTNDVALLSWEIQDAVPGGNDLALTLNWPDARNDASFNQRFAVPILYDTATTSYIGLDSCATDVRFIDPNVVTAMMSTSGVVSIGDDAYLSYTPEVGIAPNSDTAFCDGGSVLYTSGPGTSYAWSNGDTTQSVTITQSGTYAVAITNPPGCTYVSDSVTVTVWPNPPVPAINRTNDDLTSDPATTYQWYLDGNPIGGATSQTHTVATNGTYTVEVTNSFGCTSVSTPYVFDDLSVSDQDNFIYTIGPNPTNGEIWINITSGYSENTSLKVTDLLGKVIYDRSVFQSSEMIHLEAAGVYLVTLYVAGKPMATSRVVVTD